MLTPDTAHGTNPATVTMAGYEVVKVATNERGGVDLDDLRAKAVGRGRLPDADQPEHARPLRREHRRDRGEVVHGVGGTLYYDGANLNAIMGYTRPGDMGFDIVHLNLHKSFSQPHGGGGPGAGPIAVSDRIAPFLPVPRIVRTEAAPTAPGPRFDLDHSAPKSIGRLRGFQGNFGVFVRSLRLHLQPRRRRPARGVGDRGAERQLPACEAARGPRGQVPAARLRSHADARVRALGQRRPSASSR